MKTFVITLLTAVIVLSSMSCSGDSTAKQVQPDNPAVPVKILNLELQPFKEYLNITGTVEARNHLQLIAEEGGLLNRIIQDKGSAVRKGDTLAILENKILKAAFDEARAALNQARLDYESKKVLYDKQAISENEFLSSKYGVERARAAYNLSAARYSKLFITAPMSGFVTDRYYDRGAYTTPMTPVFDFIDNAYMKITAGVAERFLGDISNDTPVEITFDAFPDYKIKSKVSFVNRSIDPVSRTFSIEISVPNEDRKLAPQMLAHLKVLRRSYTEQIVIPLDAVIESENGQYVFVESDQEAQKVNVKVRAIYEDNVLVEGLTHNQNLVVLGQQELTDGDPLMIID